ncbi:F0F1 ATP synthase subunit C [Helicobacter apodemus]|uniref:ATP synthase subunit c n=1 Tax=Helicobacter apodemus TaxID=135569 RepID=A0A4U8UG09_9HELI|nr:F0F1 ATP synthase subunit C [Helicobacter apodemus]TLE16228.1 F0F1 ATP synthase subunit C [Helicobacter apodemus]
MKKLLLAFFALASVVFAAGGETLLSYSVEGETLLSYSAIAAGIGLGIAALGGAIGMGNTAAATISGMARNPGIGGKLMTTMFIALAMIEAQVIYTLVIALILLYANPFLAILGL